MINANFTAELHCRYGQIGVADTSFSEHFITSADEDGWLCAQSWRPKGREKAFKAVRFAFSFIEQAGGRAHYYINCIDNWDYKGARLERNSNGWLGLYGTHVIGRLTEALNPANLFGRQDFWKIEQPPEWDGSPNSVEELEFYLRDHLGHRVAKAKPHRNDLGTGYYLNAGETDSEVLQFTLRNLDRV